MVPHLLAGLVHVAATLAEVEVCLLLRGDAVYPQEGCVLVLVTETSLEASEDGLHVEPGK